MSLFTSRELYRRLRLLVPRTFFEAMLALIVLAQLALIGVQSLTLPYTWPRGFDDYQYHWAVPRLYLLHHAIYALPGWAHANFPYNTEMLDTLALAWNAPIAAVFLQASFGGLAVLLIVGFLARRVSRLAAWLGLALCLCNPLFAGLLPSGYAELAATFYGVAALVILLIWAEQARSARVSKRLLALGGLFAGFGLGVKYTEGQIVIGLLMLLIGSRAVQAWQRGEHAVLLLKRAGSSLLCFGLAAFLPLLPWLLKDWVLLGNPVYPFIWGGPEWDTARTQVGIVTLSHFGAHGTMVQILLSNIWSPFFNPATGDDPPFTPANYLLLVGLLVPLVALVGAARRRTHSKTEMTEIDSGLKQALLWLVVAAGGYVAWALSGAAVARYGTPWVMLLVVPAAALLALACQVRWRLPYMRVLALTIRIIAPGVILLVALWQGPVSTRPFVWKAAPLPLLTGQVSLQQWEETHLQGPGYWAMIRYVDAHVPREDRLLLVGRGAGYFLDGRDYVADSADDWIPYLVTEGHTPAGMVALLQRDGFRYLIFEETTLDFVIHIYGNTYVASFVPAFRQFLAGSLQQVWRYQNFSVYRVPT